MKLFRTKVLYIRSGQVDEVSSVEEQPNYMDGRFREMCGVGLPDSLRERERLATGDESLDWLSNSDTPPPHQTATQDHAPPTSDPVLEVALELRSEETQLILGEWIPSVRT